MNDLFIIDEYGRDKDLCDFEKDINGDMCFDFECKDCPLWKGDR